MVKIACLITLWSTYYAPVAHLLCTYRNYLNNVPGHFFLKISKGGTLFEGQIFNFKFYSKTLHYIKLKKGVFDEFWVVFGPKGMDSMFKTGTLFKTETSFK